MQGLIFTNTKELAISFEEVQENFRFFDLLDEQTKFLKGIVQRYLADGKHRKIGSIAA